LYAASEQTGASDTKITRIMTEQVVSVSPDTAIENVRWLLLDRGIGAVPVVERGATIGIVSKSDILREGESSIQVDASPYEEPAVEGSERALSGLSARDVMTPVLFAVTDEASIAEAAARMTEHRVHHLTVVDRHGALRGIVSSLDLVRWLAASARYEG
jgi:CBS domain-containing protein